MVKQTKEGKIVSNKFKNKDFTEISRKSRVKMHKSGKHWVRVIMSSIGLFRLAGGGDSYRKYQSESN
ncbi:TPA: KxYKxGKxW signal peptide domain-containing protein [Streptococcus suis]|nr:KxYKxGKxW signal peptide domain-containing protein [Streptococcus suis]